MEKLKELVDALRGDHDFPTIYITTGEEGYERHWGLGLDASKDQDLIYDIYTLAADGESLERAGIMRNNRKTFELSVDGTNIRWTYSVDKHEVIIAAMRHVLSQMPV